MPKVFVHGNLESPAIWLKLTRRLKDLGVNDVISLSPPGFGAPTPPGWTASLPEYRDWLIEELRSIDGSIHLVGHDVGAAIVWEVMATHPELAKSWATDCAGLVHPGYVWHGPAQTWQTEGVGEAAVEQMMGAPLDDRIEMLAQFGVPHDVAAACAEMHSAEMGRCILLLYRSMLQPALTDLGQRLVATKPGRGLFFVPTEEGYAGDPDMAVTVAASVDADTLTLDGLGHWWMFEGAELAAGALVRHWGAGAS